MSCAAARSRKLEKKRKEGKRRVKKAFFYERGRKGLLDIVGDLVAERELDPLSRTAPPVLKDVFVQFLPPYLARHLLLSGQQDATRMLLLCRTPALGGHEYICRYCGEKAYAYDPCRNRACPSCGWPRRERWIAKHCEEVLPTDYFDINFVLHSDLQDLAMFNKEIMYNIVMVAAWETLKEIGADPWHLGAEVGGLVAFQTWARDLAYHVHVHALIPAGGLSWDRKRWIRWRKKRQTSRELLGKIFHGKVLRKLKEAYRKDQLRLPPKLQEISNPKAFAAFLKGLEGEHKGAYIRRLQSDEEVTSRIRYLGRYVGRTGITDDRILRVDEESVTFLTESPRSEKAKEITLSGEEFLRRYLQLLIPKRMHAIRHFGYMAPTKREEEFVRCQEILGVKVCGGTREERREEIEKRVGERLLEEGLGRCARCGNGPMIRGKAIEAERIRPASEWEWGDTS